VAQSINEVRRRHQENPGARVPPHNLQAEESLLGAMLLSRDAIVAAVEVQLGADDFYKPAHGHIYEAITSLYAQGEPADPVTVADELRRANALDGIGGAAVLISLQAGTPAIGNAGRYARIVEEHALLRRLIQVAGNIAELGYGLPDDVAAAVDEAEAMVFDVAQRRVTDSMATIRDLLEAHLDHIEALYERNQEITGIPTGFVDLDRQLAGLQPANLVIVGGRPGTGKALALDTPLATPAGWTTMGDVEVGDELFDERGRPCRVTYATPVMPGRPCYDVAFDDESSIVADADHQWSAYDVAAWKSLRDQHSLEALCSRRPAMPPSRPGVVTTRQMLDEGISACDGGPPNWYVPVAGPLNLPDADLPVHPYVLGRQLGDGMGPDSLRTTRRQADADTLVAAAGGVAQPLRRGTGWVGLLDHVPTRIPDAYLRASVKQRRSLLRGLLDTQAAAHTPTGAVELRLGDRQLITQARELVASLGHKPGPVGDHRARRANGRLAPCWRFGWVPPDPLRRSDGHAAHGKASRRAVTAITPVASVPVRCITVDSPSHLYLAGRSLIPTHNTSFALGLAAHAALETHTPVLVFSLEMSHRELTQRLLCSEARVDATRMRNGRLLESDWPKIGHAVGRLGTAPLFIDDNPHLTVMEIRAKARRLKSREGLGMIVIDYLQLMSGRASSENRQVEVSEISRGLKILARELEVPVVALSQLSRNLEARADKRPVLADLRESGCLTADTRVLRADTGAEVTFGELFVRGERDIPVWSLNEDMKMAPAVMRRVFSTGVKAVFRLRTASGRSVRASANHPFLTLDGWRRVDELAAGDRIAVTRTVPDPETTRSWPEAQTVMLAHLLGDGCLVARQPVHCTSTDPASVRAVEAAAAHFGLAPRRVRQANGWRVDLSSTAAGHDAVGEWLAALGLYGLRRHDMFVPREVFSLPRHEIALFVRHLWATHGSAGLVGGRPHVTYRATSRQLVDDVQQLLLRFGIRSVVAETGSSGPRPGYVLAVNATGDQLRFVTEIGVHGARRESAARLVARLRRAVRQAGADGIPVEACNPVVPPASAPATAPTRSASAKLADPLDRPNLRRIAEAEVLWDRIVAVDADGEEVVFDATVDDTHNFVANGIVSSNSLEQDSDVVIFIYRDEVYNRDTPDKGTAEIIVAKHRNGPTGVTHLAFLDHYTRFANMART
jgi:replicative DNA helicase